MKDGPMVKIGGLYEKTSAKSGRKYLTGRFGFGARLLVLPNSEKTADAAPNVPDFNVFIVPIDDEKRAS
jgi:hypothetical protein